MATPSRLKSKNSTIEPNDGFDVVVETLVKRIEFSDNPFEGPSAIEAAFVAIGQHVDSHYPEAPLHFRFIVAGREWRVSCDCSDFTA